MKLTVAKNQLRKVMVFGTFDILHKGHYNFLKQAKKYGDFLIAVVSRDKTVHAVKKRKPLHKEEERIETLENTGLADLVILGKEKDKHDIILSIRPQAICLGYDQTHFTKGLQDTIRKASLKTEIMRLKPYKEHKYKSSKLRESHYAEHHEEEE
ncbi:MAG: adenylyltransferase/cytidyltransferase family protein [Candidatus Woesearchaeota archaeon]